MPKNVMKLLKPSPHRARNDFDLSHRHIMSMNFGELIPATCIETVPGDHIEMHAADLLRAIPMVTSPFLRAKQHLDAWFVPYHDLWHQFDNFITQKPQPVSSALKGYSYLPHVSLYNLYAAANWLGTNNETDIVGIDAKKGAERLLNYLGYGFSLTGSAATMPKVNPFRLAAYNYIWYNEYRQDRYDPGIHLLGTLSPAYTFSFDDLSCDTQANAEIGFTSVSEMYRLAGMLQMRYRTWKKDLFTGLLPSSQFGAVSTCSAGINAKTLDLFYLKTTDNFTSTSSLAIQGDGSSTIANGMVGAKGSVSGDIVQRSKFRVLDTTNSTVQNVLVQDGPLSSGFDVLSLRKSEAIQIWRENALRAGNRVKDNMLAHYGVESGMHDHRPVYLGSVSAPLNIGDVMTTANSDYSGNTNPNTNVGDVAGKGLSSLDDKVFKFDAKDFGVIMVIASVLPEAEYNATGISRPNQLLESEDFFVPEYENLGLEPVSSQTFMETSNTAALNLGYAPRYWGYKTKVDKCYDVFKTGGINAPWCSPKFDVSQALLSPPYVMPLELLYVNPEIFDVNFSVAVSVQPQFLADFYFDVDAVRPMSVVGLPFS